MTRRKTGKKKTVEIKDVKQECAFGSAEAIAAQNQQMRIDNNQAAEDISTRAY